MSQENIEHEEWISQRSVLLRAVLMLVLVILAGTFLFQWIEPGWTFEKALFFTIITITTVGYGDEGIDAAGRWTAIGLMIFGIGTATWAFSQLVQAAVSYQLAWRRRMQKKINKLQDHFIVCGFGRVGQAVCENLAHDKLPFVLLEVDQKRVHEALEKEYHVIEGCATDDNTLFKAGLHRARGIVACASSDAENIMIVLSAREISENVLIVGRASELDSVHKLQRAGATRVMAPALNCAKSIASYLSNPTLADFLDQTTNAGIGFRLSECVIGAGAPLVGRSIAELHAELPNVVFIAIKHADGRTRIRPAESERFAEQDILVVVGDDADMTTLFNQACGEEAYEDEHRLAG